MEGEIKIKISDIVNNLNPNELFTLYADNNLNVSFHKSSKGIGLYRRNLKNRIIKAFDDEINLKSFIENFVPKLSKETILKIYPQYDEYINVIEEEKQRKIIIYI